MYQLECELCNKVFASNSFEGVLEQFSEHLKQHSRKELEVLKKLAELDLKNHSAYEELKEMLREFDYEVWKNVVADYNFSKGDSH
jgi:hypothetical protein